MVVRDGLPGNISSGSQGGVIWTSLAVGGAMPKSELEVTCTQKIANPQTAADVSKNDIAFMLSVQSDGSSKVDKDLYLALDAQTRSNITQLYSAMNQGYRQGSETIGFSNQDWLYTFSFLNPAQARNQNDFVISVNP